MSKDKGMPTIDYVNYLSTDPDLFLFLCRTEQFSRMPFYIEKVFMMIKKVLPFIAVILFFSGCDVAKQVSGAYNFTQCKFDYKSISHLSLDGINLSQGIQPLQIIQLTSLLTGSRSTIPLDFTLNLDVTNPNQSAALLNGMDYVLNIDGVQFTTGSLNQTLNIGAGEKQLLPLTIGFDIARLLKGDSKDAVENIVKNFIGIGDKKSTVSLNLRPSFMIGSQTFHSPIYIPVQFSFGGTK